MKRTILIIFISILLSSAGLICFQIYWNYKAFQETQRLIKAQVDEALKNSIEEEIDLRKREIVEKYRGWLLDSSTLVIASHWDPEYQETYYTIADKLTRNGLKPFTVRLKEMRAPVREMNPALKAEFVRSFINQYIENDVNTGSVFYYTQGLGHKLENAYEQSRIDLNKLNHIFGKHLASFDIDSNFKLDTSPGREKFYRPLILHKSVFESGIRNDRVKIYAFLLPAVFDVLAKMKWVIFSSVLLVSIVLFCFVYTLKTLLSQSKLAELKNSFMNNMTHELKTPIATISIAAEAVQNFKTDALIKDEYLSIIRYQSNRLSGLIDRILENLIVESRVNRLEKKKANINDILKRGLQVAEAQLLEKNCKLALDFPEEELFVCGDEFALDNVFNNLVDNAIKYGSTNPEIEIRLYSHNGFAVTEISNDGEKIPDEYRDKIFERFFRIPTGKTHNVKGYGLGLNYVKEVVTQQKGFIKLNNYSSKTTFSIYLPLYHD